MMSWFLGVACFLLAPSLELATSFPFLLDSIDLVDLGGFWRRLRFRKVL